MISIILQILIYSFQVWKKTESEFILMYMNIKHMDSFSYICMYVYMEMYTCIYKMKRTGKHALVVIREEFSML